MRALTRKFKKKNKYGAKKAIADGVTFDSTGERDYYLVLKHREKLGLIRDIELQPKVYLTKAKILMKVDFKVFNIEKNRVEYREFKGKELSSYKLRKRLWRHYGDGVLIEIKKIGRNFAVTDEVETLSSEL